MSRSTRPEQLTMRPRQRDEETAVNSVEFAPRIPPHSQPYGY
jgi:hypothetical protein